MSKEQIPELETAVNFLATSEDSLKKSKARIRRINDEIRQLREFRDGLKTEHDKIIEKVKNIAIWLEGVAKTKICT